MATALNAGDNNPIFLENKDLLDLYVIPGPDNSILNLGLSTAKMFSTEAGNLEVALGASAGADTARQTEALLGQISASQSLDRQAFETFLGQIGEKILNLAFDNEELEIETIKKIPGIAMEVSEYWAGPTKMPRVTSITNFNFNVVPYSTAFRTPQERVKQLNEATQLITQLFMAKQQGVPLNLQVIIQTVADSFDLVPELAEWWSGEEPTPMEKTQQAYQSTAKEAQGSDIRYQGNQSGTDDMPEAPPQQGGLS
jgi:hypothetical protein